MNRVRNCFGFPLWRRAELWICLSGVPPHTHRDQAFEIIPLFGLAMFYRRKSSRFDIDRIRIGPRRWFHALTVPANWEHWFNTRFLIVLNISDKPNSAADNIQYA